MLESSLFIELCYGICSVYICWKDEEGPGEHGT